jgi:3-methyladenine DNA glycosylase/8-oxoguanine DNA glycosylase
MTPALPSPHAEGQRHLSQADPILAAIIERVGPCTVAAATKQDIFQALLRSIIYQQLHGRAAAAIHARVLKAAGGGKKIAARSLAAIPDSPLRTAGLSANKLKAIRDLAEKTLNGTVPTPKAAAKMSDDELIERLTSIRGIGPWTVHMLMIFHLGRPDVLPTGDYAVRKAFSLHFRRGRAIKPEALQRHARRWQPYRSLASWYLWRSLDTVVPEGD